MSISVCRGVGAQVQAGESEKLARVAYRLALRVAPRRLETLHNLGEHWAAQGRPTMASLAFGRALQVSPASGETHLALGQVEL